MAAAVLGLNYNDFLQHYTQATTKEQEAVAILEVFQEVKREQTQEFVVKKQEIIKEIRIEDLATKTDLEALRLATKADLDI